MSISQLVLYLKGANRCDQSLPTETSLQHLLGNFIGSSLLPGANIWAQHPRHFTQSQNNVSFPSLGFSCPLLPTLLSTQRVFTPYLPRHTPSLGLACAAVQAHLNPFTIKCRSVHSPAKSSASLDKMTHILLCAFLALSVCDSIIPAS